LAPRDTILSSLGTQSLGRSGGKPSLRLGKRNFREVVAESGLPSSGFTDSLSTNFAGEPDNDVALESSSLDARTMAAGVTAYAAREPSPVVLPSSRVGAANAQWKIE